MFAIPMVSDPLHPPVPRLLEVHEVAYLLRCSQETVRRRIREHQLKATRIGTRSYRVRPVDLEAFLGIDKQWRIDPADLTAFIDARRTSGRRTG